MPGFRAPVAPVLVMFAIVQACTRQDPPAPATTPSVALPDVPVAPNAQGADAIAATALPAASVLSPPDLASLPQTRDMPHASGPAFEARRTALWDAIVSDDPERAMPFFFPLGAYQQVKDVADPAADWKRRLVAAYRRDIHTLHMRIAGDAREPKFLGLDVPESHARWVEPGEEWNKIGYYRVFGTKLRYELDGVEHSAEVKSLISWRGEWYVVHLSAI